MKCNITPVSDVCALPIVTNYRPLSTALVLPKAFDRLISRTFTNCSKHTSVFSATQFVCRKSLGTFDTLLEISHRPQQALDRKYEARAVQLVFCAAFDRVNHKGLIYKLQAAGVGGGLLSVPADFLTDRSMRVVVDGFCSNAVDVVRGVP